MAKVKRNARDEMKSFDTAKTLGFCVQTTVVVCKPFGAAVSSEQKVLRNLVSYLDLISFAAWLRQAVIQISKLDYRVMLFFLFCTVILRFKRL